MDLNLAWRGGYRHSSPPLSCKGKSIEYSSQAKARSASFPSQPSPFPDPPKDSTSHRHCPVSANSYFPQDPTRRSYYSIASTSNAGGRIPVDVAPSGNLIPVPYPTLRTWIEHPSTRIMQPTSQPSVSSVRVFTEPMAPFAEPSRAFPETLIPPDSKRRMTWPAPPSRDNVYGNDVRSYKDECSPVNVPNLSIAIPSSVPQWGNSRGLSGSSEPSPSPSMYSCTELRSWNSGQNFIERDSLNVDDQRSSGETKPHLSFIASSSSSIISGLPSHPPPRWEYSRPDIVSHQLQVNGAIPIPPTPTQPSSRVAPKIPRARPTRPRNKWTDEETAGLLHGVSKLGIGNWKRILECSDYVFHNRTAVDLKDRFRTCCPVFYGRQAKLNVATQRFMVTEEPTTKGAEMDNGKIMEKENTETLLGAEARRRRTNTDQKSPSDLAMLGITSFFLHTRRRERRPFTSREDRDILEGFGKHGPQWNLIRNDIELGLSERSRTDLRDRFRNRYPELFRRSRSSTFTTDDAAKLVREVIVVETSSDQSLNIIKQSPGESCSLSIEERLRTAHSNNPFLRVELDLPRPSGGCSDAPLEGRSTSAGMTVQSLLNSSQEEESSVPLGYAFPLGILPASSQRPQAGKRTFSRMSVAALISPTSPEPNHRSMPGGSTYEFQGQMTSSTISKPPLPSSPPPPQTKTVNRGSLSYLISPPTKRRKL